MKVCRQAGHAKSPEERGREMRSNQQGLCASVKRRQKTAPLGAVFDILSTTTQHVGPPALNTFYPGASDRSAIRLAPKLQPNLLPRNIPLAVGSRVLEESGRDTDRPASNELL